MRGKELVQPPPPRIALLREREQHLLGMSPAPRAHAFSSFLNMVKLYPVGGFAVKSKGVRAGEAGPQKRTGLRCRVGQRDYRR